jgi:hypothetical protein
VKQLLAFGGGGNPFPGAVAGVYGPFADASAVVAGLSAKAQFSVGYDVNGDTWVANGFGQAIRIYMTAIAGPNDLPTPVANEDFQYGLLAFDYANRWQWDVNLWVRYTTDRVATSASLPTPQSGEAFADGVSYEPALTCQAIDTGVVYQWDGTAWNSTP